MVNKSSRLEKMRFEAWKKSILVDEKQEFDVFTCFQIEYSRVILEQSLEWHKHVLVYRQRVTSFA